MLPSRLGKPFESLFWYQSQVHTPFAGTTGIGNCLRNDGQRTREQWLSELTYWKTIIRRMWGNFDSQNIELEHAESSTRVEKSSLSCLSQKIKQSEEHATECCSNTLLQADNAGSFLWFYKYGDIHVQKRLWMNIYSTTLCCAFVIPRLLKPSHEKFERAERRVKQKYVPLNSRRAYS